MKGSHIIAVAVCASAGLIGGFLFFARAAPAPTTSQDWAAWAQAMGSVIAILASAAVAVAVPLVIRSMDAKEAKQDALDAAFDMGRWAHAAVAAGHQFGLIPPQLEAGLRAQIAMAEHRLSEIHLPTLRSASVARRLRQVQRLARALLAGLPPPGNLEPGAQQFLRNTSNELDRAILELARLVEERPEMTQLEIVRRLDIA